MATNGIACGVCGNSSTLKFIESYKEWKLYECPNCAVQFWWPMKHPGAGYYEDTYFSVRDPLVRAYPLYWNHHEFIKSPPHDPACGCSLLDIGCGPGTFLAAARALGYEVYGLDLNPQAVQKARELYGLENLFCDTLSAFITQNPGKRFDVVTLFEVLEHIDDPAGLMDQVRSILKPDGFIALSVPNRERFMIRRELYDFPPHHLTWWNVSALQTFCSSQDFSPICMVISPFTLRARVIPNLINCCSWSLNYKARRMKLNTTVRQSHRNSVLDMLLIFADEMLRAITYTVLAVPGSILLLWGKTHRAYGGSIYALAQRNK
ncbi:MAG: class I SAM-dependent methyltransferase [Chloroflexi bacterium]|nr:class I SAM-dependent methyltransferase [Chloroflexota bacterium]